MRLIVQGLCQSGIKSKWQDCVFYQTQTYCFRNISIAALVPKIIVACLT